MLEPELVPGVVPLPPDDVDDDVDVPGALPVPPEHAGAAVATSPNRATQVKGSRAIGSEHSSAWASATKTVYHARRAPSPRRLRSCFRPLARVA